MKAVVAAFSIVVAVLMLAQPVLAGKTVNTVTKGDVQGDLANIRLPNGKTASWGDNSPIGQADYLDIKEVSISKQKGTFVFTMTMYCTDLLTEVALVPGMKGMGWVHFLDTDLDGDRDFMLGVAFYGNELIPFLTAFDPTPIDPIELDPPETTIVGATITWHVDADSLGNPSSMKSTFCVIVDFSPTWQNIIGGVWWVDLSDDFQGISWPA